MQLEAGDVEALNVVHREAGKHRSLMGYHKEGKVFGWSYEWLGWSFDENAEVV